MVSKREATYRAALMTHETGKLYVVLNTDQGWDAVPLEHLAKWARPFVVEDRELERAVA